MEQPQTRPPPSTTAAAAAALAATSPPSGDRVFCDILMRYSLCLNKHVSPVLASVAAIPELFSCLENLYLECQDGYISVQDFGLAYCPDPNPDLIRFVVKGHSAWFYLDVTPDGKFKVSRGSIDFNPICNMEYGVGIGPIGAEMFPIRSSHVEQILGTIFTRKCGAWPSLPSIPPLEKILFKRMISGGVAMQNTVFEWSQIFPDVAQADFWEYKYYKNIQCFPMSYLPHHFRMEHKAVVRIEKDFDLMDTFKRPLWWFHDVRREICKTPGCKCSAGKQLAALKFRLKYAQRKYTQAVESFVKLKTTSSLAQRRYQAAFELQQLELESIRGGGSDDNEHRCIVCYDPACRPNVIAVHGEEAHVVGRLECIGKMNKFKGKCPICRQKCTFAKISH